MVKSDYESAGVKVGNVCSFKIETGEELVARVEALGESEEQITSVTLRRPVVMNLQPNQQGGFGVVMLPWNLGNRDSSKVVLSSSRIVATCVASKETEDRYTQSTTSIALG